MSCQRQPNRKMAADGARTENANTHKLIFLFGALAGFYSRTPQRKPLMQVALRASSRCEIRTAENDGSMPRPLHSGRHNNQQGNANERQSGPVESHESGVGTVTLNRPEVNNAYDAGLINGVLAAMDELGKKPNLRVVVLKGNGKHFQAGADLKWINGVRPKSVEENEAVSRATFEAVQRLNTLPIRRWRWCRAAVSAAAPA